MLLPLTIIVAANQTLFMAFISFHHVKVVLLIVICSAAGRFRSRLTTGRCRPLPA
ncbi:hypothetical protein KCP73_17185 [Salmonella enterica subsp. enterica]|nr:hypothetical protein KCP73_17185 [Salmonella enterica subsp. enterica]